MDELESDIEALVDENEAENELGWPKHDLLELIHRIDESTPKKLKRDYKTLLPSLNWEKIAFKNYTREECFEKFKQIQSNINKNRTLINAINDVKKLLNKSNNIVKTYKMYDNKPEKPYSAWYYFFNDVKQHIAKDNLTVSEINIKAKEMYKKLPLKTKSKYEAKAAECSRQYQLRRNAFLKQHPQCPNNKQEIKEKRIDVRNKEIKTPFELFFESEIQKLQAQQKPFNLTQLKVECRDKWIYMGNKKKAFWINWSNQQYLKYLKKYNEETVKNKTAKTKFPNLSKAHIKSVLTKSEKNILEYYYNKPNSKPHCSAYLLFIHKLLENANLKPFNLSIKDVSDFIAIQWSLLSEDEINNINCYLEHSKAIYTDRLEEYLAYLPEEEKFLEFNHLSQKYKVKKREYKKILPSVTKAKVKLKICNKSEPKPPSSSAEMYYNTLIKNKTWKQLKRSQQLVYERKWNEEVINYIKQYKLFLESLSNSELLQYSKNLNQDDDGFEDTEDSDTSSSEDEEKDSKDISRNASNNSELSE